MDGREVKNQLNSHQPSLAWTVLTRLASLKITVTLFSLSMFLVLVGTLAQATEGIWTVIDSYFRSFTVFIPFKAFLPPAWFPNFDVQEYLMENNFPLSGIFFPGGKSLGVALMVNLVSAHVVRFKATGSKTAIISGTSFIGFGLILTAVIVGGASYAEGVQDEPLVSYGFLWRTMLSATVALASGLVGVLLFLPSGRTLERILVVTGIVLAVLAGFGLFVLKDMSEQMESAMRIVWQLTQATIVGCVLLIGCSMVFRNRGGIVLLHFGIGLMMVNELFVGIYAVEEKITVAEKATSEFAYNTQDVELAVTLRGEVKDQVVSIPTNKLTNGKRITVEDLPFDIEIIGFFPNSKIELKEKPDAMDRITLNDQSVEITPTSGRGRFSRALDIPRFTGADVNQKVDFASLYLKIFEKNQSTPKEVLLLSQHFHDLGSLGRDDGANSEKIRFKSKVFELALRFRRVLKPYKLTLIDAKEDSYHGSTKHKTFGSDFIILDKSTGEQQTASISMNNPLRYKGETFYQAGYVKQRTATGKMTEVTTLQVVTNQGWMIPYIGCMYVVIGMLAQFAAGLLKFSDRIQKRAAKRSAAAEQLPPRKIEKEDLAGDGGSIEALKISLPQKRASIVWILPLVVVLLGAATAYRLTFSGSAKDGEFDIKRAGLIPVSAGGRYQPLDSFARVFLRNYSDYESVSLTAKQVEKELKGEKKRIYATEWLLDVLTAPAMADEEYRIFRIYDPFVIRKLGLETKRKGYTYTYNEVSREIAEFNEYAETAMEQRRANGGKLDKLSFQQRKSISLYSKIKEYERFRNATLFLDADSDDALKRVVGGKIIYRSRLLPLNTGGNIIDLIDSIVERSLSQDRMEAINYLSYIYGFVRSGKGSLVAGQADSSLFAPTAYSWDVVVESKTDRLSLALGGDSSKGQVALGSIVLQSDNQTRWRLIDDQRMQPDSPSDELDWEKMPGMEVLTVSTVRQVLLKYCQRNGIGSIEELVAKLINLDPRFIKLRENPDGFLNEVKNRSSQIFEENADVIEAKIKESRKDGVPPSIRDACKEAIKESYTNQKSDELLGLRKEYTVQLTAILGNSIGEPAAISNELGKLLLAYKTGKQEEFDTVLTDYLQLFDEQKLADFDSAKLVLEHFYHYSAPLFQALIFYGVAALFIVTSWVLYAVSCDDIGVGIQRSAVGILALGSLLHTAGIVERVMITGKAPITNLYASAVFISWGSVMCGFVIDLIIRYAAPKATKIGFGALLGALMGFIVIMVSFNFALRSDTFGKLEAVLDTQFWLATHVVCVTSGYVATFVAGVLGLFFLIGTAFTPIFDKEIRQGVSWIIYGIVCFALLLSFFGTVLGGLWADDSWGRFWGWDPKENGALLIVLWNALILHSRWGGLVRERGLAVLAMLGNVVTCWSWFGVNELGVGLHSYGFTEGVLAILGYVALGHLVVVVLATLVPVGKWSSYRAENQQKLSSEKRVVDKKPPKNRSKK